jgi:hypothetical protein
MKQVGEVYFALYSEKAFEPNDVTRLLGIEPTSVRHKTADCRIAMWQLSAGKVVDDAIYVDRLTAALVDRLRPHAKQIGTAKEQLGLEAVLEVVLTFPGDDSASTPAITFDRDVIAFLAEVGAYIDVDTYLS